jgi:hypothetical protein
LPVTRPGSSRLPASSLRSVARRREWAGSGCRSHGRVVAGSPLPRCARSHVAGNGRGRVTDDIVAVSSLSRCALSDFPGKESGTTRRVYSYSVAATSEFCRLHPRSPHSLGHRQDWPRLGHRISGYVGPDNNRLAPRGFLRNGPDRGSKVLTQPSPHNVENTVRELLQ